MAYSAWSVIAGEQPTTSKWNILGSNDSSFNDGSGLAFTVNNTVPANALATTAITLGYAASNNSNQTGITTEVLITGVSVSVTVPAGGRALTLMTTAQIFSTVNGDVAALRIKEGATILKEGRFQLASATSLQSLLTLNGYSATPGAHTYTVSVLRSVGSGTLLIENAVAPADISVSVE